MLRKYKTIIIETVKGHNNTGLTPENGHYIIVQDHDIIQQYLNDKAPDSGYHVTNFQIFFPENWQEIFLENQDMAETTYVYGNGEFYTFRSESCYILTDYYDPYGFDSHGDNETIKKPLLISFIKEND